MSITVGCRTTDGLPPAQPCEKPELRGPTWADVAILSVEQASAIDVCNIRNGVNVVAHATRINKKYVAPSPVECGIVGVQVRGNAVPSGRVVKEEILPVGGAGSRCGNSKYLGCTIHSGGNTYTIVHEGEAWVKIHEVCHAMYQTSAHTLSFDATRRK